MNKLLNSFKERFKNYLPIKTYYANIGDEDDITSEIKKTMWEIKEALDLPTEDVEEAIEFQ